MRFRHKLLACFLTLSAAILGGALWAVGRAETRRAEEEVRSGLVTAQFVFEELLKSRDRQLATSLKLLSGDFAFKQAVASADPPTILSAALNHRERVGADLLIVTGADGEVLADTRRRLKPGDSLASAPAVAAALEERQAAMIAALGDVPVQLAAVPLTAPDLIGTVVAGFALDDALAASLKRLTGTEVTFLAGGAVLASTLEPGLRAALAREAPTLGAGIPALRTFGAARYLMIASKTAPGVQSVVLRSWDEALEPLRELQELIGFIGAAGLAATALIGLLLADRVTSSLQKLAGATAKVARGEYDVAVEVAGRDEIGELGSAFNQMAKGLAEREKIRSVLRKAVSKEIAEALLAKGQIELGGEERPVTVLFSDIRSFTTISEGLKPPELVSQLNEYFIAMARAIDAQHGVIDKYIGDAIMALFGAPLSTGDDAANAVRAALGMVGALEALNRARAGRGLPAWSNGIGVNTGAVIAGTMGSEDRWSYTVVGDAVNLASRLEGLTKRYGARVILSEATRQAAGPGFACRLLERVIVKGRHGAVGIYEALGEGAPPGWLADYEAGLAAGRAGRWEEARAALGKVLAQAPGDGPARRYLDRVEESARGPARRDWDEPVEMTEK